MPLIFYEGAVAADAGNGVVAGLFLPIGDLPMVTAGEFGDGESQAIKESKALLGIGTVLLEYFGTANPAPVGFSIARAQTSVTDRIVNWQYSFNFSRYGSLEDGTFDVFPLPTMGNFNGMGGVELEDIFENAAVVAAAGAISGEGVLIPNSMILGSSAAALGADKRDYLEGLVTAIVSDGVVLRTAQAASGIVAVTNPANYSAVALPAAATDTTNPTTGFSAADLGKIATVNKAMSYTIQLLLDAASGQFDVNSVTA